MLVSVLSLSLSWHVRHVTAPIILIAQQSSDVRFFDNRPRWNLPSKIINKAISVVSFDVQRMNYLLWCANKLMSLNMEFMYTKMHKRSNTDNCVAKNSLQQLTYIYISLLNIISIFSPRSRNLRTFKFEQIKTNRCLWPSLYNTFLSWFSPLVYTHAHNFAWTSKIFRVVFNRQCRAKLLYTKQTKIDGNKAMSTVAGNFTKARVIS